VRFPTGCLILPLITGLAAAQQASPDRAADAAVSSIHVDANVLHSHEFVPERALGTSIDVLRYDDLERVYTPSIVKESLSAGWGPISYRLHSELAISAWHWNGEGTWSDGPHRSGYFTGSSDPYCCGDPPAPLSRSRTYSLPHRGTTRNDGAEQGYSRITDGDARTYWKSNPYLTSRFTGENDELHPQWVVIDLGSSEPISGIRIEWGSPYARRFEVQHWDGKDPFHQPMSGNWIPFSGGQITDGHGGVDSLRLSSWPVSTRFVRIWMTESSNTCDNHGSEDPRNCAGYAIRETYIGNPTVGGELVDLVKHTPDQNQTVTVSSSSDPWHSQGNFEVHGAEQTGMDLLFTSGITNHLPAMIPVSLLYGIPEDAAAQIAFLRAREYPVLYVEMGEEPDGQFMLPEDYGALYLQWAAAIHKVDPKMKLGGPVFEGVNEDIKVWPDALGESSWLKRFLAYLRSHGRLSDLAFMSFEHYPFEACDVTWSDLFREPKLMSDILQVWRHDGLPDSVPMFITESNVSPGLNVAMADIFAGLWLADSTASFLTAGGAALYHSPIQPEALRPGCRGWSTYGNFVADKDLNIRAHTSQYYVSRLINREWVEQGAKPHRIFPAASDLKDTAGNALVTGYPVQRPDDSWSLLLVNRDQSNPHQVRIVFDAQNGNQSGFNGHVDVITFGSEQYVWRSAGPSSHPDPEHPPVKTQVRANENTTFVLPQASVTVLRGRIQPLDVSATSQ